MAEDGQEFFGEGRSYFGEAEKWVLGASGKGRLVGE